MREVISTVETFRKSGFIAVVDSIFELAGEHPADETSTRDGIE